MENSITQMINVKKITFFSLLAIVFCFFSVQAQNRATFLVENFEGTTMPAGWSIAGAGQTNWSISTTNFAGGTPNEVKLYGGYPMFNGTSRLVTPAIDLTGIESVFVSFKHSLDNYTGSHTLGIATSLDGIIWHSGWSQTYSSNGNWTVNQEISTEDMGFTNVKFCIYYTGSNSNIYNWYFDDVNIFTQEALDISLDDILVNSNVASGKPPVIIKVTNRGLNTINSLQVNYKFNGHVFVTEDFSDLNLESLETSTLTFTDKTVLSPGNYNLTVWISELNGVDNDGDILEKLISVDTALVEKKVMIEHFTSSTCGPCVNVNTQMQTLTENNPGKYCYIKYQMNWPYPGDPYYTAEGGTRRTYYDVNVVPHLVVEGGLSTTLNQGLLDQYYNMPAYVDIKGSFQINGNIINIKADVFPNISVNGLKLFVVVNEKVTYNNIDDNGETSFHHVMMKMLPDAQGTPINLVSGELQSFEFSHDMSTTHVEEMDDLEVAIFIQNLGTGELHNSRFAYEYTDTHPYPPQNLQLEKVGNNVAITWNAPSQGTPTGYNIYAGGELVAENQANTSFTIENYTEHFVAVQIKAVYGAMTSVAITETLSEPVDCESPTELTAAIDGGNVVLSWTASTTAESYYVYRNGAFLENVTTTTFTDFESMCEASYYVTAICEGGYESTPSNEIQSPFTATYIISATASENGTITPAGDVEVNCGDNQTFTISANADYQIADVLVDGISVGKITTYTFTNVKENHTIEATFEDIQLYTITATAGDHGIITPSGEVEVWGGADRTFWILANADYRIADVLVDGESVGKVAIYTFTNVTADHTIEATFEAIPTTFIITASAGNHGTISPSGEIEVAEGENQTFAITPDADYQILDVLVDDISVGAVATYTFTDVNDNHTIVATFETVGISEIENSIKIYPNPTKDFVKVEGENIEIINVYNTLGQLVKTVTVNDNSINVSVSNLQHGIYIFDVKTAETVIRNRVVILR